MANGKGKESVVYRKAQGKRNLNQSTMFRVDCETTVKEGCRGQRKQPIGTSGERKVRDWGDTNKTLGGYRGRKLAGKARERRTKRRADTIGTRAAGCKLARGDCQACRKAKASQASGRHAWRKHVGNSKKGQPRKKFVGVAKCGADRNA